MNLLDQDSESFLIWQTSQFKRNLMNFYSTRMGKAKLVKNMTDPIRVGSSAEYSLEIQSEFSIVWGWVSKQVPISCSHITFTYRGIIIFVTMWIWKIAWIDSTLQQGVCYSSLVSVILVSWDQRQSQRWFKLLTNMLWWLRHWKELLNLTFRFWEYYCLHCKSGQYLGGELSETMFLPSGDCRSMLIYVATSWHQWFY